MVRTNCVEDYLMPISDTSKKESDVKDRKCLPLLRSFFWRMEMLQTVFFNEHLVTYFINL